MDRSEAMMARGRMINTRICDDKDVNELSDDTSRLAFTWLISWADCEGRVFGDPVLVRSKLFPRREDVTSDQVKRYMTEWAERGLVVWYEINGDQWCWFPNFDKNQPGLRKDREPDSEIPAFDPDVCRIIAGCLPDDILLKRREEKLREEKRREVEATAASSLPDFIPNYSEDPVVDRIFTEVTGWISIPSGDRADVIQAIQAIRVQKGAQVRDYLRPFFVEFRKRYPSSSRCFWLTEWALSGHIPDQKPKNHQKTQEEVEAGLNL